MSSNNRNSYTSFSPLTSSPTCLVNNNKSVNGCNNSDSMSLVKSVVTVQSKKSDMFYNTCYYQVRGQKVIKYSQSEFRSSKQNEFVNVLNDSIKETYKGQMSPTSAINLKKKIQIWYDATQLFNCSDSCITIKDTKKLVFLTLTLSATQIHSDKQIKLLILKPFFRILRDKHGVVNYVWKAEKQQNGNIHFHCIIDRYIPKTAVQFLWNKAQENLGYISVFEKKYNHRNPPSTSIKLVNDSNMLISYMEKYICKSDLSSSIEGAVWKASKTVLSLQFFEFVSDSVVDKNFDNAVASNKILRHDEERYSVFDLKNERVELLMSPCNVVRYDAYKLFLQLFLFYDPIVSDFRTFCFLFSGSVDYEEDKLPVICSVSYPKPFQLSITEFYNFSHSQIFKL
jgi:hypothetical protein